MGIFCRAFSGCKRKYHTEFNTYYEIAAGKGMSESVFERKLKELAELKQSFAKV